MFSGPWEFATNLTSFSLDWDSGVSQEVSDEPIRVVGIVMTWNSALPGVAPVPDLILRDKDDVEFARIHANRGALSPQAPRVKVLSTNFIAKNGLRVEIDANGSGLGATTVGVFHSSAGS